MQMQMIFLNQTSICYFEFVHYVYFLCWKKVKHVVCVRSLNACVNLFLVRISVRRLIWSCQNFTWDPDFFKFSTYPMSDLIPSVDMRTGSHRADPGFCVGGGVGGKFGEGFGDRLKPPAGQAPRAVWKLTGFFRPQLCSILLKIEVDDRIGYSY